MRLRRIERQLDALRDGLLKLPEAEDLERRLASDTEEGRRMRRTVALGDAVRIAWQEGPEVPAVEALLVRLRPALDRVDAEVRQPSALARAVAALRDGPEWVPALATAGAAAGLVLALLAVQPVATEAPTVVAQALPEREAPPIERETVVYDLEQQGGAVLVFDAEAATILWAGDGAEDLTRSDLPSGGIV